MDKNGVEKSDIGDVAEVFATFFESLYDGSGTDVVHQHAIEMVEAISLEEVRLQLRQMKTRKAADEHGIVVELLRCGSDFLLEIGDIKPSSDCPRILEISLDSSSV